MEPGGYKSYGYRWIALAVFALIQASIQVLWSSFLPITSEAAAFYGVTPLLIGLLSMLFMIVYVFTSLPTSWAVVTFGVRNGMGVGVILMGIFGPVRGFFGHNYTIVLVATVMLSIAQPFIINSITTMSARWFPVHERATATGIAMLAQFIGIMAGMAVSPILAGSLGGIMMVAGIVGCIVLPLLSDKTRQRKPYLLFGVALIVPGLLGFTFFHSFALLLLAGAVLGFFQLGLAPIFMEVASDVCKPAPEATSQGVLWMFGQGISVLFIFLMDYFRTESGAMTPLLVVLIALMALSFVLVALMQESRMTASN